MAHQNARHNGMNWDYRNVRDRDEEDLENAERGSYYGTLIPSAPRTNRPRRWSRLCPQRLWHGRNSEDWKTQVNGGRPWPWRLWSGLSSLQH
jgi:hypothetical protein